MKPVEREGHIDAWICVKQASTGQLYFDGTITGALGTGIFSSLKDAQHHQTIALLKNEKMEIFHLEWPL